jgi:tRNA modification GTPase
LADADLVLLVLEANYDFSAEEAEILRSLEGRPHLIVRNKADLLPPCGQTLFGGNTDSLFTSAITGEGIEALRVAILNLLQAGGGVVSSGGVLNSLRQQEAVASALDSLAAAETANATGVPHEFLLADLHGALGALDSLTGQTTSDDILSRIFSTFCIGK